MNTLKRACVALLFGALLALTACGAMPSSGDVLAGELSSDEGAGETNILASGPVPGSDREQIVRDFVTAASSPTGGWSVAKQFLAPGAEWDASASVSIDDGQRTVEVREEDSTVVLTTSVSATVDASGVFDEFDAVRQPFKFSLKKVDGQWRITSAPAGILLERSVFTNVVYNEFPVMFWDATYTYLVPDVRWYPRALAPAKIADALLAGPRPGQSQSAFTAFPSGSSIRAGSVQLNSGVLALTIGNTEGIADTQLGRMQLQLLRSIPGVRNVEMTVGSSLSSAPLASSQSTRVDPLPLVLTKDKFGSLSGSNVQSVDGWFESLQAHQPSSMSLSRGRDWAAIRDNDGRVLRVFPRNEDPVVLDDRPSLIDPAVDPWGWTWSVPSTQPGQLRAVAGNNEITTLTASDGSLSSIQAMQMSGDGTRLAVAGVSDAHPSLGYFPILRNEKGEPSGVGAYQEITTLVAPALDVAWTDDATVAAVVGSGSVSLVSQTIGGTREVVNNLPSGVRQVVGGNSVSSTRLITADGTVYIRRGSLFASTATGVKLAATQLGTSVG